MLDFSSSQGKGIHKYRLGHIAIVDYILTILVALIISLFTIIPLDLATVVLLGLSFGIHSLVNVSGATNKFISDIWKV
jgi:hypothetical protein